MGFFLWDQYPILVLICFINVAVKGSAKISNHFDYKTCFFRNTVTLFLDSDVLWHQRLWSRDWTWCCWISPSCSESYLLLYRILQSIFVWKSSVMLSLEGRHCLQPNLPDRRVAMAPFHKACRESLIPWVWGILSSLIFQHLSCMLSLSGYWVQTDIVICIWKKKNPIAFNKFPRFIRVLRRPTRCSQTVIKIFRWEHDLSESIQRAACYLLGERDACLGLDRSTIVKMVEICPVRMMLLKEPEVVTELG